MTAAAISVATPCCCPHCCDVPQVFIESMLLTAPRHLMVAAGEVQKRPYQAGQPATHTGKIQYRQCKRGVWPPSNWDPAVAVRSAQLPEAEMELEFVHGFDGWVGCWVAAMPVCLQGMADSSVGCIHVLY